MAIAQFLDFAALLCIKGMNASRGIDDVEIVFSRFQYHNLAPPRAFAFIRPIGIVIKHADESTSYEIGVVLQNESS